MRENCTSGSVRGAPGNRRSYRKRHHICEFFGEINMTMKILMNIKLAVSVIALMTACSSSNANASPLTSVAMDFNNWDKVTTGNWAETSDGLHVYGSGYRQGCEALSKQYFNFSDSETYYKWKPMQDGYTGLYLDIRYGDRIVDPLRVVWGPYVTTNHQWGNSVVVNSSTWYYTRIKINQNQTADIVTSTDNYDSLGGTSIESHIESISAEAWNGLTDGYLSFAVGDNYGGTSDSILMAEAKTTASPLNSSVPEPTTILLFGIGYAALAQSNKNKGRNALRATS